MKTYKREMIDMVKVNINKETIKAAGIVAGKVGKAIVIEGIKGVLLKSATKAITTSFDGGIEGVKRLTIDDYVGSKKKHVIPDAKLEKKTDKVVVEAEYSVVEEAKEN